jgi:hypothetical protein
MLLFIFILEVYILLTKLIEKLDFYFNEKGNIPPQFFLE